MKLLRTGIILNTRNFDACCAFYRDIFGLKAMFSKEVDGDRLTCFEFGGSYLMIETGGHANPQGKSPAENATKLRFHVPNLEDTLRSLQACGIDATISRFDWGATINLFDPDGNRVGIREESEL